MKNIAAALLAVLLVGTVHGHPGGLDAFGCHKQKDVGHHCHRDGKGTSADGSRSKLANDGGCPVTVVIGGSNSSSDSRESSRSTVNGSRPPPVVGDPNARNANGEINRSSAARNEFVRSNPCPATRRTTGKCPGYHVDHIVPLACGGPDSPKNMQWLTAEANLKKGSMGCKG